MKAAIKKHSLDSEYYTEERCFITELSNYSDDAEASIARAKVEPGITTRWHRLRETAERYYILGGTGCVEIGDLPAQEVTAGDIVIIPPMCRQRIRNTGSEDLLFLAICTPRYTEAAYEDLEPCR